MKNKIKRYIMSNKVKIFTTIQLNFVNNLEIVTSEMKKKLILQINDKKAYFEEKLSEHKKTQKTVYDYLNSDESIEIRNKIMNTKMYHDPYKLEAKKATTVSAESIIKSLSNSVALQHIAFEGLKELNSEIKLRTIVETVLYYTEIFCNNYDCSDKKEIKKLFIPSCRSIFEFFVNQLESLTINPEEFKDLMSYVEEEEMKEVILGTNNAKNALEKCTEFNIFVKEQEKNYEQFKNEKIKEMQDIRDNIKKAVIM